MDQYTLKCPLFLLIDMLVSILPIKSTTPSMMKFDQRPPTDARRYQPGHVSYLGYAALYEGLEFIEEVGVAEAQRHSLRLAERLARQLDGDRYRSISPDPLDVPIAAFAVDGAPALEDRLRAANMVIAVGSNTIRVSPAIYNNEEDIDLLAEVLNS